MDDSFQSFENSQYERPNQPFDCGHACEGLRCPLGPTVKGDCQADFECAPQEKGGQWKCSRSPRHGGKCDEGPNGHECSRAIPTCSPVASIRRRRGAFVLWCCTATLGATLVMLGASWRDTVIKPGELSNQHAQIIKDKSAQDRCATCHTAVEAGGLDEWTQLAFSGSAESGHASQSQRCLSCHRDKIGTDATALLPHGLATHILAGSTQRIAKRLGREAPREISLVGMHDGQVACSACHREHQGSLHDLTAMSNGQCAECHQENFRNLAIDHPEFGDWPYKRRTRIGFDHAAHQGRYFPEQKQAFTCRDCHASASSDGIVGVVSYEQNCQSCHEQKIDQSFDEGVPLIALPMLDLPAFEKEGFSIGEWPEMANGDFDGALPPLTRVLLSSDPFVRASITHDFEFTDVDPVNIDDLQAAVEVAWELKKLIYDLAIGGPDAIALRLEVALGRKLTPNELRDLLDQLPSEKAVAMQRKWFPNLAQEVAARADDKPVAQKSVRFAADAADLPGNGWQRDDETLTFRFRPQGHANRFLTGWLTAISSSPRCKSEDLHSALRQMTSQTAAGLCATCHSVDVTERGASIHWFARKDSDDADSFIKFSHAPHTILPQLDNCTACHQLNADSKTSGDYAQTNPLAFSSGFHPMTKQGCATCHAPRLAGDQCTMCHQYHIGSGMDSLGASLSFPSGDE